MNVFKDTAAWETVSHMNSIKVTLEIYYGQSIWNIQRNGKQHEKLFQSA